MTKLFTEHGPGTIIRFIIVILMAVTAERRQHHDSLPKKFSTINLVLVVTVVFLIFIFSSKLSRLTLVPNLDKIFITRKTNNFAATPTEQYWTTFDPSIPVEEELKIVLENQEDLIRNEMNNYPYPNGLYGHNASNLSEFLMDHGGQPIRSVLLTTWRSGSTFLGDVLDSHPANYYHYEPLLNYEIIQVRGGELAEKSISVLKDLLHCNYTGLDDYLAYGPEHNWLFLHNSRLWEQCKQHPRLCWTPQFLNPFCKLFPVQSMKSVRLRLNLAQFLLNDTSLNVRILYLVRDPRGTMQSRKHRDWCPSNPDCWDPSMLCEDLVSDYWAAKKLLKLYPSRLKVMRYEDVSVEPYDGVKNMLTFFGLDFHPNIHNFLDTHTKENIGGVSSTFRDSKVAPFHWRQDLNFSEVQSIQKTCSEAMNLWGYEAANSQLELKNLNPVKPLYFE